MDEQTPRPPFTAGPDRPRDGSAPAASPEMHAWCRKRGISEHQLRSAIDKVGDSARRVREYFRIPR